MNPSNADDGTDNGSEKEPLHVANARERRNFPKGPSGKEIAGIGLFLTGIILILVAIAVLMIDSSRRTKDHADSARKETVAQQAEPATATSAPSSPETAPRPQSSASPKPVVEVPTETPTLPENPPTQGKEIGKSIPVAETPLPQSAQPESEAIPPPVTNVPDAAISDFVQSIQVFGTGAGRILLLMPGQSEARAYREGDMLDSSKELTLTKIGDRKIVIADTRGNKYYKAF